MALFCLFWKKQAKKYHFWRTKVYENWYAGQTFIPSRDGDIFDPIKNVFGGQKWRFWPQNWRISTFFEIKSKNLALLANQSLWKLVCWANFYTMSWWRYFWSHQKCFWGSKMTFLQPVLGKASNSSWFFLWRLPLPKFLTTLQRILKTTSTRNQSSFSSHI